jgi:hypothetical protein
MGRRMDAAPNAMMSRTTTSQKVRVPDYFMRVRVLSILSSE